MAFPDTRMRRLRATANLRGLVRETELSPGRLVLPMFVAETTSGRDPIATMPGVDRLSISAAVDEAGQAAALGLAAVLLFGVPAARASRRCPRCPRRAARRSARGWWTRTGTRR